jgi:hypothetical protein
MARSPAEILTRPECDRHGTRRLVGQHGRVTGIETLIVVLIAVVVLIVGLALASTR